MQALQDHDTVLNVIDAVDTGTEMSSAVAGMRTDGVEVTLGGNVLWTCLPQAHLGSSNLVFDH